MSSFITFYYKLFLLNKIIGIFNSFQLQDSIYRNGFRDCMVNRVDLLQTPAEEDLHCLKLDSYISIITSTWFILVFLWNSFKYGIMSHT